MKSRNAIVLVVLLALIGLAVYQSVAGAKKEPAVAKEGSVKANYAAPAFELEGLDGGRYRVGGQREKPVVVNFWATWCPPCKEEAPDLQKLYEQYKDQIDFYGVNLTQSDKLDEVRGFVNQYGLKFPILLDKSGGTAELYKFVFIPTSYLIDRQGNVREVVNVLTYAEWEKKLKELAKM
ncbi:redoxin domain-containing protein [Paenibacillus chartarius]|uniref:Redoxin domain-containing protein n=1 Tax=Paenibacillus chartarius TaxID=747481 RepID=A0ABV6DMB5_9BACL